MKFSPWPVLDFGGTAQSLTCCFTHAKIPQPAAESIPAVFEAVPLMRALLTQCQHYKTRLSSAMPDRQQTALQKTDPFIGSLNRIRKSRLACAQQFAFVTSGSFLSTR